MSSWPVRLVSRRGWSAVLSLMAVIGTFSASFKPRAFFLLSPFCWDDSWRLPSAVADRLGVTTGVLGPLAASISSARLVSLRWVSDFLSRCSFSWSRDDCGPCWELCWEPWAEVLETGVGGRSPPREPTEPFRWDGREAVAR